MRHERKHSRMMHFFTSQAGSTAARSIRLDTLVNLRWLAISGQLLAVFIVYFALAMTCPCRR